MADILSPALLNGEVRVLHVVVQSRASIAIYYEGMLMGMAEGNRK
jgi:hypothetical protein